MNLHSAFSLFLARFFFNNQQLPVQLLHIFTQKFEKIKSFYDLLNNMIKTRFRNMVKYFVYYMRYLVKLFNKLLFYIVLSYKARLSTTLELKIIPKRNLFWKFSFGSICKQQFSVLLFSLDFFFLCYYSSHQCIDLSKIYGSKSIQINTLNL